MPLATKTLLLSALFAARPALAQGYPYKTVTLVVPFTAGGGVDAIARLLPTSCAPRSGSRW